MIRNLFRRMFGLPVNAYQPVEVEFFEVPHCGNRQVGMMITRAVAANVGEIRIWSNDGFLGKKGFYVIVYNKDVNSMWSSKTVPTIEEAQSIAREYANLCTDLAAGRPQVIVVRDWNKKAA
jgi:hypothetical protein